jgi:hypothetical protein
MKEAQRQRSKQLWELYTQLDSSLKDAQRLCDDAMWQESSAAGSSISEAATQFSHQSTAAGSKSASSQTSTLASQKDKLTDLAELIKDCRSNLRQGDAETVGNAHAFVLEVWTQLQSGLSAEIESIKTQIATSKESIDSTTRLRRIVSFVSSTSSPMTVSVIRIGIPFTGSLI